MPSDTINYQNSGYFSKIIIDYLNGNSTVEKFYNLSPSIENFQKQLIEKEANFTLENRNILHDTLAKQYHNYNISKATQNNISLLKNSNTFTITTGHQLNLFTGPLYFLYKIVTTINLCKELKQNYSSYNFVPVYWMASEDHDFEEINHFHFKNGKIQWTKNSNGPVGRLTTEGLDEIFNVFESEIGISNNAEYLKSLFKKSYLEHTNLADATRFLVNELFGNKGLVILDGDDANIKRLFIPYMEEELQNKVSFKKVTETNKELQKNYTVQVNPREINLFYIEDNLRERILIENHKYKINNTNLKFSKEEIMDVLKKHPEKFSPNVILRPLYQEVILPNLCYIGGGGELAYWFQLKSTFNHFKIPFPILLLRNSVLLCTKKQVQKADKINISWEELFLEQQKLFFLKTKEYSNLDINFSEQRNIIKQQFEKLKNIALQTDKSFVGAVNAQEKKQLKGLDNLEKRLLKAEKKVHIDKLDRILTLQNELFPNHSLQERVLNFSEFYIGYGPEMLSKLFETLQPLSQNFSIITL